MKRGISSLSFSGPLQRKIEAAARAGYDGIEIFREDLIDFDGTPVEAGRLAADSRLEVFSLQSLRDFEAGPESMRASNLKRATRFLELAAALGAPLLVVCANTRPDTIADPDRAAADLARLADLAAERGLRIGYEALATSAVVRSYAQAWDIIRRAARPNLGLVVGAVHTLAAGADFAALGAIDPARIFLVHLADAPGAKMDARLLARHFRVFPGQGELPVAELYATLKAIGYDGPVSLEIFNDQVRAMLPRAIASDGIRSFGLLEEAGSAAGSPPPSVLDIGFVEFACHGEGGAELRNQLAAMGFVETHRHRTKEVSLYRQGGIDLVLNAETDGPAHSFYLMHGLSVCGIAFTIDNLPAMVERFRRYLGGEVLHLANPGEMDIPGVHGLGGSMIFCLDGRPGAPAFHQVDFDETAGQAPSGTGGLLAIDHYSQAVMPTDFLTSLLFYRSMFGFRSDEQVDIIDPHGTVRSRALSNGDRRVCMSLNSSIGPSTMTQRYMAENVHATYQHFAFRCDDLLAYAATLDPELVLPIPANYYGDLLLRFDLDPGLVAAMRARNILYDQDPQGNRYLQLYTREINGLVLEVVQRDGYAGVGAANAPVRIAAQARDFEQVQNLLAEMRGG